MTPEGTLAALVGESMNRPVGEWDACKIRAFSYVHHVSDPILASVLKWHVRHKRLEYVSRVIKSLSVLSSWNDRVVAVTIGGVTVMRIVYTFYVLGTISVCA